MPRSAFRVRAVSCLARRAVFVVTATGALSSAHANGPEVGFDAGAIYPVDSRAIQLVSETVDIRLASSREAPFDTAQRALCTYELRNLTDSTQRFAMAFVTNAPISPESPEAWQEMYRGAGFQVWQDGRPRRVHMYPDRGEALQQGYGVKADSFPAWRLAIRPRATSIVRMRYRPEWSGGSDGETVGVDFTYYAKPAARWAARIEKATFRLHLGDTALVRRLQQVGAPWRVKITPQSFTWTRDGLCWEFRDWEPDTDLRIVISQPTTELGGDPSWNPWTPDSLAAMPAVTEGLDAMPEIIERPVCRGQGREGPGSPAGERVRLRVYVDALGRVRDVRFPDPPQRMRGDAEDCVWSWRFHPALRHGQPVPAWRDVTITYP